MNKAYAYSPTYTEARGVEGMRALLPQPGGFEGLLVIPEELGQDDLAVSERRDLAEPHVPLESRMRCAHDRLKQNAVASA